MEKDENLKKAQIEETEQVVEVEKDEEDLIDDSITSYQNIELEEDDEENSDERPKKNNKNLMPMLLIGFGIVLLILLVIFLMTLFIQKNYTYESLEEIMKTAANNYMQDHKNYLPSSGSDTEVSTSTLIGGRYMKDFSQYNKKHANCTGRVLVHNESSNYTYTPYLNCGEEYSTISLGDKIKQDNKVTTTRYGLYEIGKDLVFRGEELNNYVKMDKRTWRIVKINSNNQVILIDSEMNTYTSSYDDRYNSDTKNKSGKNRLFVQTRIKEYLDLIYQSKTEERRVVSDYDKAKMQPFSLCISKRFNQATGNDGTIECSETLETKLGLLSLNEYMQASTDPECKSAETPQCSNYNYLTTSYAWWLSTPYADTTYEAFAMNGSNINIVIASTELSVRPVIAIRDNTVISGGKGTYEEPYIVK